MFGEEQMGTGSHGATIRNRMLESPSRVVSTFKPLDLPNGNGISHSANRNAFKEALYQTFTGKAEGVLTPYLFYDPPEKAVAAPWGTNGDIPFGARAWDKHIADSSASKSAADDYYNFGESDADIIKTSLSSGLLERLPKRIAFYSYGPGDLIAVRQKECQVVEAIIMQGGFNLRSFNAVDNNDRYSHNAAGEIHKRFNMEAQAIQGDFMEGDLRLGNKDGTSVIAIFGGPFANAPSSDGNYTSKEKAVEYLYKLTDQHGIGTQVVMTIDIENNMQKLLRNYAKTRAFEAFVLSSFPRGVQEGIIMTPYNVFEHWRMVPKYDEENEAVKLIAKCKKTHTLRTEDTTFTFKKGDEQTNILSSKWSKQTWGKILKAAGFTDIKFYEAKGNSKVLLTAKAWDRPKLDLL